MVRFVDSLLRTTIAAKPENSGPIHTSAEAEVHSPFARDRQRLVLVKLLFPLNLVVASFAKSRVHQSIDQFRHLTTLCPAVSHGAEAR